MRPKDVVKDWVEAFNRADVEALSDLYSETANNHQDVEDPDEVREAVRIMCSNAFARAKTFWIIENIFEDGEWGILEWRDQHGLRGCRFFHIVDGKIVFQRGYCDHSIFRRLHSLAIPAME